MNLPARIFICTLMFLIGSCGGPATTKQESDAPEEQAGCVKEWSEIATGVEYRDFRCNSDGNFDLHLVRIDPGKARIDAVIQPGGAQNVKDAFVTMNANFFDQSFKTLGVVMSGGKMLNQLHPVEWQSVFYVTGSGKAGIVPSGEWKGVEKDAITAVQAGPRLTVGGAPNRVARATPQARSAVCVTADKVVFLATASGRAFDVHEMVGFATELGCRDSLLLDGGPSTQLIVNSSRHPVRMEGDPTAPAYLVVRAAESPAATP